MLNYFENFPKIHYPIDGQVGSKEVLTTDMTVRFKIVESIIKTNPDSYYDYYWNDEDRVDIVAQKYYGDSRLSWVVMMSSQIFDWIYDLPLNSKDLHLYLQKKYEVADAVDLKDVTHHYEDFLGVRLDKTSYDNLPVAYRRAVSIYDYEHALNESKRNVKLISKIYINYLLAEFENNLQSIKNTRALIKYDGI